ncbi:MAG: ribonuclease [Acidimicrobiaceae bacterium]
MTRWVDTKNDFDDVLRALEHEPVVGLDTEFHRERTYHPQLALVQLVWGPPAAQEIALVDATTVDLAGFARVLDSDATIVMHSSVQDVEVLLRACGVLPAHLFDTQIAAGFAGYNGPSLATLVQGVLGIRLPKGDRLADWLRRPLSEDQRTYAASDVEHLLPLHRWLLDRLEEKGRVSWAEDECTQLLAKGAAPRDPNESWWKVKEARQLRGKAVGVAQALAAWRERRANETDQPVRFVLPDLALVGIAQRPPTTVDDLRRVRGLDDRHLRGSMAETIMDVIDEGLALPKNELRLPPTGDVDRDLRAAVALVSAWISQLSRQLQIDTTLLATRADVEALLRGDESARLTQGWRADVLGQDIRRLVEGRAALSFDGKGGLVLEDRS